jgi:hypothetical protein
MKKKLRTAAGFLFLLLGVIGCLLPVIPQIPFFAVGILLIGPHHPFMRPIVAKIEKYVPWLGELIRLGPDHPILSPIVEKLERYFPWLRSVLTHHPEETPIAPNSAKNVELKVNEQKTLPQHTKV